MRVRARGFALIAVLWALVLLAALAAAVAGGTRTEAALTRNGTESAIALGAAEAGVMAAVERLVASLAPGAVEGDGGQRFELELVGVPVRVALFDACGRVDLNEAPLALLEAAFAAGGFKRPRAYADAVVERRRQRRFDSEAVLRPLLDLDVATWRRLRPLVTVHCRQAGLDSRFAARALLERLPGIDRAVLAQLLERRAEPADPARAPPPLPGLGAAESLLIGSHRLAHVVVADALVPGGATERLSVALALAIGSSRPYALLDWRRGG